MNDFIKTYHSNSDNHVLKKDSHFSENPFTKPCHISPSNEALLMKYAKFYVGLDQIDVTEVISLSKLASLEEIISFSSICLASFLENIDFLRLISPTSIILALNTIVEEDVDGWKFLNSGTNTFLAWNFAPSLIIVNFFRLSFFNLE